MAPPLLACEPRPPPSLRPHWQAASVGGAPPVALADRSGRSRCAVRFPPIHRLAAPRPELAAALAPCPSCCHDDLRFAPSSAPSKRCEHLRLRSDPLQAVRPERALGRRRTEG